MTRCRGVVDDCYSSTRYRGGNQGHSGHRSRVVAPAGRQTTWCKKAGTGKKVSFANPLVQIMGHPSKERCILDMLESAPGWIPVSSPTGHGGTELAPEVEGHTDTPFRTNTSVTSSKNVQHLSRLFTKNTMEALQTLVEEGKKPRSKKKSKVVPTAAGEEEMAPVV